jgi:hypothetical protein
VSIAWARQMTQMEQRVDQDRRSGMPPYDNSSATDQPLSS